MSHEHEDFSIKMPHKHGDFSLKNAFLYKKQMPHNHARLFYKKCLINMEIFL